MKNFQDTSMNPNRGNFLKEFIKRWDIPDKNDT